MARTKLRCVRRNHLGADWRASLTEGKTYERLPAKWNEVGTGWLRIVDDSGEDYLYPASLFEPVEEMP